MPTPETVLQAGDVVAIGARRRVLLGGSLPVREEVVEQALLEFPMATLDVVVTKREAVEQPLSVLAERHGRGVVLAKLIAAARKFRSLPRRSSTAATFSGSLAPSATSSAPDRRSASIRASIERVGRRVPRPGHCRRRSRRPVER